MEGNGDWIRHLNEKFDQHQRWLQDKLDEIKETKLDKEDFEKLEIKVEKIEDKTDKLFIKQATIAGVVTATLEGTKAAILKVFGL